MPRTEASEPGDQPLLDNIEEFGWHCLSVAEDDEHQPFTYTIGLYQSYGIPELLIYGMPGKTAHAVLCIAANAAARGTPIDMAKPTDDLLEDYPCVFVPVPLEAYREHVGYARWYYEGDNFPVQQIVWPSKEGFYPWDAQATEEFRAVQPVLGKYAPA